MTTREGITCYERDEQLCENPICMRYGCIMTDETAVTPLQKLENRVAALEGTVAMLQAQLALLDQQQYRGPNWPQIDPNVRGSFGEIGQ
jgi:hypothetical protein